MNQPLRPSGVPVTVDAADGRLTLVSSVPILWGCGGTTTTPAPTPPPHERRVRARRATRAAVRPGTVGTQFNWVPDVEWAAWYLGDANGHFAERNVTSELGHGGPNTPAVVQVLAAGDGNVGISASELDITKPTRRVPTSSSSAPCTSATRWA